MESNNMIREPWGKWVLQIIQTLLRFFLSFFIISPRQRSLRIRELRERERPYWYSESQDSSSRRLYTVFGIAGNHPLPRAHTRAFSFLCSPAYSVFEYFSAFRHSSTKNFEPVTSIQISAIFILCYYLHTYLNASIVVRIGFRRFQLEKHGIHRVRAALRSWLNFRY